VKKNKREQENGRDRGMGVTFGGRGAGGDGDIGERRAKEKITWASGTGFWCIQIKKPSNPHYKNGLGRRARTEGKEVGVVGKEKRKKQRTQTKIQLSGGENTRSTRKLRKEKK